MPPGAGVVFKYTNRVAGLVQFKDVLEGVVAGIQKVLDIGCIILYGRQSGINPAYHVEPINNKESNH